jgi:hypothetical protein
MPAFPDDQIGLLKRVDEMLKLFDVEVLLGKQAHAKLVLALVRAVLWIGGSQCGRIVVATRKTAANWR